MKLYFLRHQAAGILHDAPFSAPPTQAEIAPLLNRCATSHGNTHHKTGEDYWTKVICVDTSLPVDHPDRTCTHGGARGESAAEADAKAAGHCPIREGEIVPERFGAHPANVDALTVGVTARGSVENPK